MDIAIYTIREVSQVIVSPEYIVMLIMLITILYSKNKKTAMMQKMIIGENTISPFELTISQIVLGILAGTLGSIILSYLGVIFTDFQVVLTLFMISIMLMFLKTKFLCFSYSGGIVAIISVAIQLYEKYFKVSLPQFDFLKVDVLMLVSLVAVLHIVEGILVMIDGSKGAIPVFTNRDDKIIGGFIFKRYWAIPIVIMFIMQGTIPGAETQVSTPSWWPLLRSSSYALLNTAVVSAISFYGMLGYNSVTFTKTKKQKVFTSGMFILSYGIIMLLIAQVAKVNIFAALLVGILMPVAHEAMLRVQSYFEIKGEPKYVSSEDGLMVLEVAPESPAFEMGIQSGDVLVSLNDKRISNEEDMLTAMNGVSNFIWLKIKNVQGKLKEIDYNKMNTNKKLGIVFVPRGIPKDRVVVKFEKDSFKDVLDKIKKMIINDEGIKNVIELGIAFKGKEVSIS